MFHTLHLFSFTFLIKKKNINISFKKNHKKFLKHGKLKELIKILFVLIADFVGLTWII